MFTADGIGELLLLRCSWRVVWDWGLGCIWGEGVMGEARGCLGAAL